MNRILTVAQEARVLNVPYDRPTEVIELILKGFDLNFAATAFQVLETA